MKYRAYVIYGGQFIYGRSAWRNTYAEARSEGRANATADERDFIGVIDDGPDSSPFVAAVRRGINRMEGIADENEYDGEDMHGS